LSVCACEISGACRFGSVDSDEFVAMCGVRGIGELGVVVAAIPKDGFLLPKGLAGVTDADVKWICRENLKKNRLRARFPKR
jgi:hypothetical protein